jgi:transposase
VHDLPEAEKHCGCCGKDLRLIEEETSERYEYIPASIQGNPGRAEEVRLRLHGEDGGQAGAAD